MGGARAKDTAAKSLGGGLASGQPTGWVPQWTVNVIPPSSLPLNHCLCVPTWGTPFGRALGKKWGASPSSPSSRASLFSVPVPGASWEQEHKGVSEGWGGGRGLGRLAKPPTEGALGPPDSRAVIVHFLLGCGSFLGPLWPPPSGSPPSSSPPPLFLGQVSQSSWKQAGLQTPCFSHLLPNPTTHSCSREDESSSFNHPARLRRLNRNLVSKPTTVLT